MDALELFDVLGGIEIEEIAEASLQQHESVIANFNRLQMLDGKRHDGLDITPSYFNDPYFETREAAVRYSEWKDKITPNRKRTPGTPNLYINGFYQSTILATVDNGLVIINSEGAGFEDDITEKYTEEIYGLNDDYRQLLIDDKLQETFEEKFTEETGLKFS